MSDEAFDVAIVGGGPAGYVGAIRAAQLGLRVVLVERGDLGGVCLNWGCIPTKALLHSADLLREMRSAGRFGLLVGEIGVDLKQAVAHSRSVAARLRSGVRHLLKKNKVTVVEGQARLGGPGRVEVAMAGGASRAIRAEHVVLATGARARRWPGLESADASRVWSYREALAPQALPRSLVVIGAGAIGMEFASFYATLGTAVTVVEARERVLPAEDEEVSAFVQHAFEHEKIAVRTGCSVESIDLPSTGGVRVRLASQAGRETLDAEKVLVSIGVAGNVDDLGLEGTAVRVERGFIVADAFGATAQKGVYAVGDVAGAPWLAHKASHQAVACVERIAGVAGAHAPRPDAIPACTFCHPQVASVGLTEHAARQAGREVAVGRFPFSGNGKAIASGLGDGFVKTVFDAGTGELLGAHLVGAGVTELVQGFAIARVLESTEAELAEVVFPHPTLSESMHESVLAAFGRVVHV